MNLASRCREALSHVAMLKRELASHQRRSAEALAMQRNNSEARVNTPTTTASVTGSTGSTTPKPVRQVEVHVSTPPSVYTSPLPPGSPPRMTPTSLLSPVTPAGTTPTIQVESPPSAVPPPKLTPRRAVDVAKELEILDNTVASFAMKTKPVTTPAKSESSPSPVQSPQALASQPVDSDDFEEDSYTPPNYMPASDPVDDVPVHRPPLPLLVSPKSMDDVPANRPSPSLVASPRADALDLPTNLVSPSKTYFPHTASPKVMSNYNEEYPGDISAVRKRVTVRPKLGMLSGFKETEDEGSSSSLGRKLSLSSIDAFEASFSTDFPENFSPRDAIVEEKKMEVYNPFQSPGRGKPSEQRVELNSEALARKTTKDPPGKIRTSQRTSMHNKVFSALSHSPRALEEERGGRPSVSPLSSPATQQPQPFRKTGYHKAVSPPPMMESKSPGVESARARYAQALQQHRPHQVLPRKVPFDEPRSEEPVVMEAPPSPRQEDIIVEEEQDTPISVKDRLSMFSGGGALTPEKETIRLSSLNNSGHGRRSFNDRSYEDEGDIPMMSNIGRKSTNGEGSPIPTPPPKTSNVSRGSRVRPWEEPSKSEERQRRIVRQPVSSTEPSVLAKGRRGDLYLAKEEKTGRD
jgi:hypothetical protein